MKSKRLVVEWWQGLLKKLFPDFSFPTSLINVTKEEKGCKPAHTAHST